MTIIESLISSLRTMHVANINLANEAAGLIERQQEKIKWLEMALNESRPTGKAPCIKFCEATAFRSEIAKLEADNKELKARVAELEAVMWKDISKTGGNLRLEEVLNK